jgi:hypothetical protein
MATARPAASLKPALLARKGGARPAMRSAQTLELGAHDLNAANLDIDDLGWNDFGSDPAPVRSAASSAKGRRAAFTLRLDSQRHFRLRLASTLRDCSAQLLLTEALDRFLETIPQLDVMAAAARRPSEQN